ncbi:pyridoxamine 5'-phosphate oxidase family protein [Actinacidiphila acidipaludis]|uniref:Pyridoxamine 5'-phosphate oxidase family protein n=1 Tax=Actinacidiphila acidipaludis TaxID=2873382 RepID=A0ABS7QI77_9ACTN|nr:pyridoxamine 5'-phosphate oxidase family protein [Streptomyces acidipaludis]MBY8882877.1 pyridoxamine 5'-phosphate oxidase family protein [Streptomyces acidipaludis]
MRELVEVSRYLVLSTADAAGRPWGSPVYFAHVDCVEFLWVSSPDVTHSRNIAVRPEVGLVVFDSHAAIGTGQGVYMPAVAEALDGDDAAQGIEVFSRRCVAHGGAPWTAEDVRTGGEFRLYRAVAQSHGILAKDGSADHRIPVDLSQGRG